MDGYYAYMEESKMAARKKSVAGEEASGTNETDGRIKVREFFLKAVLAELVEVDRASDSR